MQTLREDSSQPRIGDVLSFVSRGVIVLALFLQPRQARRGELRITPFTMSDTNTLAINVFASDDGHPLDDISVNIPWLAFCSGSYLKREGRIVPMPSAILRHALDGFGYSDKTTTFDDEFGLPRTIELSTSKQLY
jgi:hypothetical protein